MLTQTSNKNAIYCGDINIYIRRQNQLVRKYKQHLNSHGFQICNTNITRQDSATIIDHIFNKLTENDRLTVATIANEFSDHDNKHQEIH